jgi:histidinol dehydrogenase
VLCTPPDKFGNIHPAILYTAQLTGVTKIFAIGGMQAIGAMTFGTESVPKTDKIFGPGNQYVMAAKRYAQLQGVAIDMPAGPSEVLVIADESCNPSFVAADLLSQAEHGPDSQVMLVTDSKKTIKEILKEIDLQIALLPRQDIAAQALKNSRAILLNNLDECLAFSNLYAPEHLILAIENSAEWAKKVINAGSVFLGRYSCESLGDYASGTNHTLPTSGFAKAYSGVSLDSFVKKITFQQVTERGICEIGPAVETMAEAEQLLAHKNAVTLRLKETLSKS